MLKDLQELQRYTHQFMDRGPASRQRHLLPTAGCDVQECARLAESLPSLPESYIVCIREFDLRKYEACYFRFRPRFGKAGIIDDLIFTNLSNTNPMLPFLQSHNMYEVAAWEADPICVATSRSSYPEGTVLWVTLPEPQSQIMPLSDNFEAFMLTAGNLDVVRGRYSKAPDRAAALGEFNDVLRQLNVKGGMAAAWGKIAEVVL